MYLRPPAVRGVKVPYSLVCGVALVCYFSVRSNFFLQEMCIEGLLCAKICSKTIEGVATFPEMSFMEHESYKAHSPWEKDFIPKYILEI